MSYPDVIKAVELRQGDQIFTERAKTQEVLATCWRPGRSFISILLVGESHSRQLPISRALYVVREGST